MAQGGFSSQIAKAVDKVVTAALSLHQKVASTFLPTAIKFHYIFNLRDLSNIFQVKSYRRCNYVEKEILRSMHGYQTNCLVLILGSLLNQSTQWQWWRTLKLLPYCNVTLIQSNVSSDIDVF